MQFSVISPAMFNLFNDCKMKFFYQYVEQIPPPVSDENFVEGKNIHNLASYCLKNYDIAKYEKILSDRELKYWNNLKNNPLFSYEVIGVEKNLVMKTEDFIIGGRIDAIVKQDDDYYILDYKTGGVNSDKTYDYQTMVYLLLCDEFFKQKHSLTFVYLDLKNNKEVKIKFSDKLKSEFIERIKKTYFDMIKFKPESFDKISCAEMGCKYSKLCTFAKY